MRPPQQSEKTASGRADWSRGDPEAVKEGEGKKKERERKSKTRPWSALCRRKLLYVCRLTLANFEFCHRIWSRFIERQSGQIHSNKPINCSSRASLAVF